MLGLKEKRLFLVLISLCLVFSGVTFAAKGGNKAVRAALRVDSYEDQEIALPDGLPDEFTVTVPFDGLLETIRLQKMSVRGPNFRFLVQGEDGELVEKDPGPVRTYMGTVDGDPEATVAASLKPSGLRATIHKVNGNGWSIRSLKKFDKAAKRNQHAVFSHLKN